MRWFVNSIICLGCFVLVFLSNANAATQYAFVSPAPGAVIAPGQQLEIVIQGPPAKAILVGGITWADSRLIGPPLYKYSMSIPDGTPVGIADITAMIQPEVGPLETISVSVKIEPNLLSGARLVISPQESVFTFLGQAHNVSAKIADKDSGAESDLSDVGAELAVISSDSSIVAVDKLGGVVAVQPGSAYVTYQYRGLQSLLLVDVRPSAMRGDLNADRHVDMLDIGIVQERSGLPKVVPNDSRDINGDGKIDALDLRLLTTLCTRPRCAIP